VLTVTAVVDALAVPLLLAEALLLGVALLLDVALLLGVEAADDEEEDVEEHAAAVTAAPRARLIGISLRPDRWWLRLTEIFTETRSPCGPCRISI
jgi:hypothetical protein